MGGRACEFYGAAEFSRDCDIVIVADDGNLARLNFALSALQAECIAEQPETSHDQFHKYVSIRSRWPGRACERFDDASNDAEGK